MSQSLLTFAVLLLLASLRVASPSEKTTLLSCKCPKILKPKCCKLANGVKKIVSNSCVCECRKQGKVIPKRRCHIVRPSPICKCRYAQRQVCCLLPGARRTSLISSCHCRCRRGRLISRRICSKHSPSPSATSSTSPTTSATASSSISPKPSPTASSSTSPTLSPTVSSSTSPIPTNKPGECTCPAALQPVCCRLPSGKKSTRNNACLCNCDNGSVFTEGSCTPIQCNCSIFLEDLVCCRRNERDETEGNACLCECAGGEVISKGMCPSRCFCSGESKPVQCLVDGQIIKRANECLCTCIYGTVIGDFESSES